MLPLLKTKLASLLTISTIFAILYSNLNARGKVKNVQVFRYVGDAFNPWYYSFIVSSTIGFGDIIPLTDDARALTILHVLMLWIAKDYAVSNATAGILLFVCVVCFLLSDKLTFW